MRVLFAAAALLLTAFPAAAADAAMTGEQIRELAKRDLVWCENYRPEHKDCETMTLVSLMPDGRLRETGLMQLSKTPDLKMVIDGSSKIDGDKVCSVFGDDTVRLSFLLNNQPAPRQAIGPIEAVVRESMSEFEGKTLCQTFYRGSSELEIREMVTVDGQRREDLESSYRLQPDEAGLNVRPAIDEPEETMV
jgi:hypothetical protein